jgi:beta-galactosidase
MAEPKAVGVRFGAAYYHEYQPYERLNADLNLMVEAGINVIRVGESVWSTWEPRENQFNLDWLAPILDAAHQRGISAIIGTPTYAVPPWLRRKYPETTARTATGVEQPYGARQDVDYSSPGFRYLAERLVRKIVARYRDHPAVIGWQVDNEPGLKLFYNHSVFQRFLDYLRDRYGDVDTLNQRWGLTYWSHRLSDWADMWTPDGNTTPSYDLAWRRYQAELTHDYIRWQAELVRGLVPDDQFVTTCVALGQVGLDITKVGEPLDIVGTNVYYATQDALELPGPAEMPPGLYPFFVAWGGPAWMYLQADLSRGTRQQPFLVTETNASSIGGPADNFPSYRGQLRQVVWSLVARGARLVEYWHWHSLHYGAETYWGGILGHSLEPGRIYAELAAVGAELAQVADLIGTLEARSDVAVLVSAESRWAMEFMGPLRGGSGWMGDSQSYDRILAAFYRGLFDAGLAVDVVAPGQLSRDADELVRRWPALVVPGLYIATDETLELLRDYAEAGGHLVLTPRTGYADEEAVVRHEVMPGLLRKAAGVRYLEFTNLRDAVPVTAVGAHGLAGAATGWADELVAEGAEVLAAYDHPHLREFPAATTNAYGRGRVTYIGTVPDRELAAGLAAYVAEVSVTPDPWRSARPPSTTCTTSVAADGRMLRFVHNWSWEPVDFTVPTATRDLLSDQAFEARDALTLGAWDVRILVEDRS